ncbi:MAG: hypothetical protein JWO88_3869 [Frankiales bacterium]|nr:hypothetical protein [Frankiales bacterium]
MFTALVNGRAYALELPTGNSSVIERDPHHRLNNSGAVDQSEGTRPIRPTQWMRHGQPRQRPYAPTGMPARTAPRRVRVCMRGSGRSQAGVSRLAGGGPGTGERTHAFVSGAASLPQSLFGASFGRLGRRPDLIAARWRAGSNHRHADFQPTKNFKPFNVVGVCLLCIRASARQRSSVLPTFLDQVDLALLRKHGPVVAEILHLQSVLLERREEPLRAIPDAG